MTSNILNHPMIREENLDVFTDVDHNTWKTLFARQAENLKTRACQEILDGMNVLHISADAIPKFSELNKILMHHTGFSVIPVTGLIPEPLFFEMLVQRKFPSTCFIRKPEQLEYLEEPDIFHDTFGHVPLLANPIFADFMELFGRKGLDAVKHGLSHLAGAIYWYTVEFGLIQRNDRCEIYGAGIVSSPKESIYATESEEPARIKFDLLRALRTNYQTNDIQKTYFVIDDFKTLFDVASQLHWDDIEDALESLPSIEQGEIIDPSEVIPINGVTK